MVGWESKKMRGSRADGDGRHKWRNLSDTKCARMVFILLDIKPLAVNGELIKEELGDLAPDYVSRE